MSLAGICFLIIVVGLIWLVCFPPAPGNGRNALTTAVIVAGVIWTVLQFVGSLPVK